MTDFPQGPWQPPGGPAPAQPPYGQPPYGPPPYGAGPHDPHNQPPYGGPPPPRRGRGGLIAAIAAGALVLLVVIVTVVLVVVRRDDDTTSRPPAALPNGLTATVGQDGTVSLGRSGVLRPVVDVYVDFQCPVCKSFHETNDATLRDLATQGKARVVYRPITIFSGEPLAGNSTRAAAAARCVRDGARWLGFTDRLFAHQPPEGRPGFSVEDLVKYGSEGGVTGADFASCVRSQRFAADVRNASQAAVRSGLTGTPTVRIDGRTLNTADALNAGSLKRAIERAG